MKSKFASIVAVMLIAGFVSVAQAEKKEVELQGDIQCGKCKLKEADKCQNVLIVTEGDEKTTYWLAPNKVAKDFHGKICSGEVMAVVVKGTVSQNDEGKKVLHAKEINES